MSLTSAGSIDLDLMAYSGGYGNSSDDSLIGSAGEAILGPITAIGNDVVRVDVTATTGGSGNDAVSTIYGESIDDGVIVSLRLIAKDDTSLVNTVQGE